MIAFSSAALSKTVDTLLQNRRDLLEPTLSSFYEVGFDSQDNLDERYIATLDFRVTNDLPIVQRGAFGQDTSTNSGPAFFLKIATALGIEETYSDDLILDQIGTNIPDSVLSFVAKQQKLTPDLYSGAASDARSFHLSQDSPTQVADEDSKIYTRTKQAYDYVRELIK